MRVRPIELLILLLGTTTFATPAKDERSWFHGVREHAGVHGMTVHDLLRHTAASLMVTPRRFSTSQCFQRFSDGVSFDASKVRVPLLARFSGDFFG